MGQYREMVVDRLIDAATNRWILQRLHQKTMFAQSKKVS
jgi:hypothetical protein